MKKAPLTKSGRSFKTKGKLTEALLKERASGKKKER